jgi:hypothetical protein
MLERQIEAVLNQSIPVHPTDIHVWYNESGIDQPDPKDVRINTYRCNWNTKFFGRFTLPHLCRTKYIAIFDDDNLPMENWLRSCLHTINQEETNGILGGTGVTLEGTNSVTKIGWNGSHLDRTSRVDYVGQTWFFRREWAKYMWYEEPTTRDNGEDITFSYLAQKHGGINTFVPPHPESDKSVWSTDFKTAWDEGRDSNASWRLKNHLDVRYKMMESYVRAGWETVNSISYE